MEYKIIYLQRAVVELLDIAEWHGSQAQEQIQDSVSQLKKFPNMGRAVENDKILCAAGYRKLISGDFVIIYKVIKDEIFIYHIANVKIDYTLLF